MTSSDAYLPGVAASTTLWAAGNRAVSGVRAVPIAPPLASGPRRRASTAESFAARHTFGWLVTAAA